MLTVITDKGDYVLDNQNEDILIWSETGYRFVKRQSQSDPAAGDRHGHLTRTPVACKKARFLAAARRKSESDLGAGGKKSKVLFRRIAIELCCSGGSLMI